MGAHSHTCRLAKVTAAPLYLRTLWRYTNAVIIIIIIIIIITITIYVIYLPKMCTMAGAD